MHGTFTFQSPELVWTGGTIGGRADGTKPFSGAIHGLENYFTETPKPIPQALKKLIIDNQQVKEYISPEEKVPAEQWIHGEILM